MAVVIDLNFSTSRQPDIGVNHLHEKYFIMSSQSFHKLRYHLFPLVLKGCFRHRGQKQPFDANGIIVTQPPIMSTEIQKYTCDIHKLQWYISPLINMIDFGGQSRKMLMILKI